MGQPCLPRRSLRRTGNLDRQRQLALMLPAIAAPLAARCRHRLELALYFLLLNRAIRAPRPCRIWPPDPFPLLGLSLLARLMPHSSLSQVHWRPSLESSPYCPSVPPADLSG